MENLVTTPSGLKYLDIQTGSGATAQAGQNSLGYGARGAGGVILSTFD